MSAQTNIYELERAFFRKHENDLALDAAKDITPRR
jgi:hypothetical protein